MLLQFGSRLLQENMNNRIIWSIFFITIVFCNVLCLHRTNWAFHFPQRSGMGIFAAVAVPVDISNKNVYMAYSFEANYPVPGNETSQIEYPPLITDALQSRSSKPNRSKIDRFLVYEVIEGKLRKYGYDGYSCLLRAICESAMSTFVHNGVIGDILHIIFTPSSSKELNYSSAYVDAESNGREQNNCTKYYKNCNISIMDMIS